MFTFARVGAETAHTTVTTTTPAPSVAHAPEDGSSAGVVHLCPTCNRTCTAERSAEADARAPRAQPNSTRRTYADVAAEVLASVVERGDWQAWADRMGISRQAATRFGAVGGPRVAVGDALLLPRERAIAYLLALVQRLRGGER